MIKEIAFVGYPVKDIKKARAFYEGLLGLSPSEEFGSVTDETVFIEYNIGSSTLSLGKMEGWDPSPDGPNTALEVDNFDELMAMMKEKNVPIVLEPQTYPSCRMAVVRDPDGNQVTIHQRNAQ
jgi:catechol 2,3-dioxygenase-like lactoylglutathione lyase family enzyme